MERYDFKNVSIRTVRLPWQRSYLKCLKALFGNSPLEVAYYDSKRMKGIVEDEAASGKYDLIFCHLLRLAPYLERHSKVKKVLDICDALSLRYAMSSGLRRDHFKAIENLEAARMRRYEPAIADNFNMNLVASPRDKTYLEKIGVKNLEVVENGVEPQELAGPDNARTNCEKIIFFGNLRTFHNIDAIIYFYKEIFPLIRQKIKGARFVIVGANVPGCVRRLAKDSSVAVFEDVADIRPFIEDACVSVAPMRFAVGIQNKILQSMASMVPVVTTSAGLGGISATPGEDILLADNPVDFADNVIMLMKDGDRRRNVAAGALRLIKEKYLWPDIVAGLNKKISGMKDV